MTKWKEINAELRPSPNRGTEERKSCHPGIRSDLVSIRRPRPIQRKVLQHIRKNRDIRLRGSVLSRRVLIIRARLPDFPHRHFVSAARMRDVCHPRRHTLLVHPDYTTSPNMLRWRALGPEEALSAQDDEAVFEQRKQYQRLGFHATEYAFLLRSAFPHSRGEAVVAKERFLGGSDESFVDSFAGGSIFLACDKDTLCVVGRLRVERRRRGQRDGRGALLLLALRVDGGPVAAAGRIRRRCLALGEDAVASPSGRQRGGGSLAS
ncbi:hypothetical protein IWX90DRAFT_261537 [Phyllosticta citrichinensis]|uniref:Uncharacterized protein n=1 Tax=Phyllosticta citrichinensis TaxID=1130410 RepID=A0ABR1XS23_9PEZI